MAGEDCNEAKAKQEKSLRAMQVSFKKRKACIMKKTMELSVLCDVEACAIVVDASGEVATWPENQSEVVKIINRYKDLRSTRNDKKKKEALPLLKDCVGGEYDDDRNLLEEVDSKIHAVMKRIEFLKSAGESVQPPCLLEYYAPVPEQSIDLRMVPVASSSSHDVQSVQRSFIDMFPTHGLSGDTAEQGFLDMVVPQQSTVDMASTPGLSIDTPEQGFLDMLVPQQSIVDMVSSPGLSEDTAEQGFLGMLVPQQSIVNTVSAPGLFGDTAEQGFLDMVVPHQSIIDMVPTPGLSGDMAEQDFLDMVVPQFVREHSRQSIFNMLCELNFLGDVSEQQFN